MNRQITNENILIFGGSGSLGNKLIEVLDDAQNKINVFSRDENKHWHMKDQYKNKEPKINFIIGDIRNEERVREAICLTKPTIIIIAAAMKHIDSCEFNVNEALETNTKGVMNVCNVIYKNKSLSSFEKLKTVVFISTDKATSPTNVYGMTKSISERITVEFSQKMSEFDIKFVNCRYGNIINSRGSIIPKLQTSNDSTFYLTHPDMTRFIMTQEQATQLIKYSILYGQNGETIITKIKSIKILDLFQIFAELRSKNVEISKIRPGEKLHEELLNEEELNRTIERDIYYIIKPSYYNFDTPVVHVRVDYTSANCLYTKTELVNYLYDLKIININIPNPYTHADEKIKHLPLLHNYTFDDVSIMIGVKDFKIAEPVLQSLSDCPVKPIVVLGQGVLNSFSRLVNHCISISENDIVIFCSHKVTPTRKDIELILSRINRGYLVTSLYRFACIAFHKSLIDIIGFMDERFLQGGCEDLDYVNRFKLSNIAYFEDENPSVNYISAKSLWIADNEANVKRYLHKWQTKNEAKNIKYDYKFTIKHPMKNYLKWNEHNIIGWSKQYMLDFIFQ